MEFLKGKKLSQREKVLLILVAVAAIAASFYFFIYQSQIEEMARIRSQLETNNAKLNELKGFDKQLKTLEKEVDQLDEDIYVATQKWFPSLKQDIIIKDLENKIRTTNLTDGAVKFASSQEASIAEFDDKEKLPTIAEALTLSFVTLMQEEQTETAAATEETTEEGTTNLIEKAADALSAPTPTPGPDGDETTTAFAAKAGTSNKKAKKGDLDPVVQEKLDALKKSLSGLTEKELQEQIETILESTDAKIDKLEIEVTFQNSSYRNIMDFINKVENTSPNIYVTSLKYSNVTDAYISQLQSEVETQEQQRVDLKNIFRSANNLPDMQPNEIIVDYKGVDKYSGSITLVYFAVSKIHK